MVIETRNCIADRRIINLFSTSEAVSAKRVGSRFVLMCQ